MGGSVLTLLFKVVICGDSSVGKTSLVQRYLTGVFKERYQLTIGTDFYVKKMMINDKKISLNIWDFAGEQRFKFLLPSTLIGAEAVIFMYDISRFKTLENLQSWIDLYKKAIKEQGLNPIAIMVGAKLDLEEMRGVPLDRASLMVKNNGLDGLIECSSKSGKNVEEIFDNLAMLLMKKYSHISKIDKQLKIVNP